MNQWGEIKIYLESPCQMLFDKRGLYRKRKIRKDPEEFILEEAKALRRNIPISIIIYLPADQVGNEERFASAIHQHFDNCKSKTNRERKRTMQYGWRTLAIAFVVLGVAFTIAQTLTNLFPQNGLVATTAESLTILGWVALWKPAELLLYAWYPYHRDTALYIRLEQSEVQLLNLQEVEH